MSDQRMTVIGELKTLLSEILSSNRIKSFVWRSAMMFLAGIIDVVITIMSGLELKSVAVVLLGLMLGEISKYLNKKYNGA